ncbi:MAG: hypothetical protein PUE13_05885 [Clostridiales bacterium]|nr:hypothetical protein [Clostridiales bacterium]
MTDKEALFKMREEFDKLINSISFSDLTSPSLIEKALRLELKLSAAK